MYSSAPRQRRVQSVLSFPLSGEVYEQLLREVAVTRASECASSSVGGGKDPACPVV